MAAVRVARPVHDAERLDGVPVRSLPAVDGDAPGVPVETLGDHEILFAARHELPESAAQPEGAALGRARPRRDAAGEARGGAGHGVGQPGLQGELVEPDPELDLYDQLWPVRTYQPQLPAAKFLLDEQHRQGQIINSIVSSGCVISSAKLKHALLFSSVRTVPGSVLEETVVLPEVQVGNECRIKRAVIDRGCAVPDGLLVGEDSKEDARRFRLTPGGVTLITAEMLGQKLHVAG